MDEESLEEWAAGLEARRPTPGDRQAIPLGEGPSEASQLNTVGIQHHACRIPNGPGIDARPHNKQILIDGYYNGAITPRVYTGSANLTGSSLRSADEAVVRITSASYLRIQGRGCHRLALCPRGDHLARRDRQRPAPGDDQDPAAGLRPPGRHAVPIDRVQDQKPCYSGTHRRHG